MLAPPTFVGSTAVMVVGRAWRWLVRLLVAVALTVSLLSAAASAASAPHRNRSGTPVRIPGGRGHRPIAGWAFISRGYELSHATVSLWTLSGREIPGGSTRTGPTGEFTISPLARDLPRTFVVTVQGGFIAGRRQPRSFALSALVHRRDLRQIVYVGLASTVLRDYMRARPRVAEGTAATRVRRLLGIPAWHNLGFDLYNISARWYSAAKVMHAAAAHRGMRKLVRALVRAAERGRSLTRPLFEGPVPLGVAAFGGPSDTQFGAAAAEAFGGQWFLQQLAGGVISAVGSQGAGWAFNQLGFSPTPAYVSQIQNQLNQLAAQMSQLKDEVSAVNSAVQATYSALLQSELTQARSLLDTAMGDMSYVAAMTNADDRAYWSQQYFDNVITPIALDKEPWGSTLQLIDNVMVAPGGGVNPLGLQSAIYIKSEGPFWTLTKSQQMWQTVDFWTQYAVEALDVYVEYEHQVGGQDHCDNPPTDAGCPLQAQVDYTQTLGNQALATLQSQGKPLKPLPSTYTSYGASEGGVTMDTRTGLMWGTPCHYLSPTQGGTYQAVTEAKAVQSLSDGFCTYNTLYPFYDFKLPTRQQLQGLIQGCGCDSNHPTGVQWLVTNGVMDSSWLQAAADYKNTTFLWTSDPYNVPPFPSYWIVDVNRNVSTGVPDSFPNLYLPVRTPTSSEGPYYP